MNNDFQQIRGHSRVKKGLLSVAISGALFAAWSTVATALPSAYVSRFGALDIQNSTSSVLLRDTEDSHSVYVLPPTAGQTEFKGLVPSANLLFCSGIKNLAIASNTIDGRIGALADRRDGLMAELDAARKVLIEAQGRLGQVAAAPGMTEIMTITDEVDSLDRTRAKILVDLDTCTQSCEALMQDYHRVRDELAAAKNHLSELRDANRDQVRQYSLAKSGVEQAEASFMSVGKSVDQLQTSLVELANLVMEMYATKGKLEGGYAQIDYNTGWTENVNKLSAEYPQYAFSQISTANARIYGNLVGATAQDSYYSSLPMILDYTINGMKYVPWGDSDYRQAALPSVMTGSIRLSALGACPIADPNFFTGSNFTPARGATSLPLFSISASYEYPVAFKYKVTASYNLYKFYEQIKKSGTRGGLFSSSSYSEVVENKIDRDAFTIDWLIEDPNSEFTSAKRAEIAAELKKDLMNRVLVTIAQPGIPQSSAPTFLDAGIPPEHGSVVLANGLRDTCGFNIYCQAGSWILRGADAIWGSSSAQQSFQSTWDRTATEAWSAEIATYRAGLTSFKR